VTGATGFVGQFCVATLLERGISVHAISRNAPPEKTTGVVWHRADLLANPAAAETILRQAQPTHLLHLAWETAHGDYWHAATNADWLAASLRLVRQFFEHGGNRVVTVGSGAEYASGGAPCHEHATPCAPLTLYGSCKHALNLGTARLVPSAAAHAHARLFQVYGPGEDPRRLVPTVLRHLRDSTPLPCTAGNQLRDFVYVEHAAQALVALLLGQVAGPVNIASGRPMTVRDFALSLAICARADAKLLQFGDVTTPAHEQPVLTARVERLRGEVRYTTADEVEYGLYGVVEAFNQFREGTPCPTLTAAPYAVAPTHNRS
jgi:nucleoside-diphosphate-sugar epimerase